MPNTPQISSDVPKRPHRWKSPYVVSESLADAVNLALLLGRPLLLSGEPGTGKTTLAARVAEELSRDFPGVFSGEVHQFNTKSSSQAGDLFYRYDNLRRFGEAQLAKPNEKLPPAAKYLRLEALGKGIAGAAGWQLPDETSKAAAASPQVRSVVLIDEVDKAPRDFPNDLLNEIERYEFTIPELDEAPTVKVPRLPETPLPDPDQSPLVLLTTNRETQLPEAFLRRCLYFHLEFPDADQIHQIVRLHLESRFGPGAGGEPGAALQEWIHWVLERRKSGRLAKPPSTAEIIDSARGLRLRGWTPGSSIPAELKRAVLPTLFKTLADRQHAEQDLLAKSKSAAAAS